MARARFRSGPDGIIVTLRDDERDGLAAVLEQFRQLLIGGGDASMLRFQPPVHLHDHKASEEFWEMAAGPLLRHRLNSLRLYLGNTLEVGAATFDPPQPGDKSQEAARYMLYEWLGGLLDQLVSVAAEGLPPGTDD